MLSFVFLVLSWVTHPSITQAAEPLAQPFVIEQIQQRAHLSKVADSREWLLLGHYRKRLLVPGYKSEIDGVSYFLSPNGKVNPQAELDASLAAFAQPITKGNDNHPQCRYFARRNFLFDRLAITEIPKIDCPLHANWKKELDVVGASVIFASSYLGNPASMFGHTFLKLHSRSNKSDRDLLNYGVSFAADTGKDGGAGFAVRGLTGGYHGGFTLLPYHQTLQEYTNLEGRDVYEYSLNLTQAELDRMLDHLLEVQNTYFDYYFLDENCSYQLLSLLEVARPSLQLTNKFTYFVIPADTVRRLVANSNLVKEIKYRPSLETELYTAASTLSEEQRVLTKELVKSERPPIQLAELSTDEQVKVYDGALKYVSLLAFEEPKQWKNQTYQLESKRAQLGVVSPQSFSTAPPRPEEGHDSSQLGLGFGVRERKQFIEYHARAAYHHLLSDETGYLPNSQLEVARLSARTYLQPREKTLFHELAIVDVIALAPWSSYFKPLSWRANIGFTRLPDQPFDRPMAFVAEGGVGTTIALEDSHNQLWFTFVQLHTEVAPDIEKNARTGAGIQSQFLLKPFSFMRATGGIEYRDYFLGGDYKFVRVFAEAGISLTRNAEIRGGYSRTGNIDEGKALIIEHLMF